MAAASDKQIAEKMDLFHARRTLTSSGKTYTYYQLDALNAYGDVKRLPYSIKVLLEAVLRQCDGEAIAEKHVKNLAKWGTEDLDPSIDVPFIPARIVLQDFTGVPAVVDLAALRKAMADVGGDPDQINPEKTVDLVIDHSVQVDRFARNDAFAFNKDREFERNNERYQFLKWAQGSFQNFHVIPPDTGIVHQINLEYLASVVFQSAEQDGTRLAYPDTLIGTDSHTTMINGLGVLGWGVGGIEAEAGMLGQPSYFPVPEVIGVRIDGELTEGTTATDLALRVTQILREEQVVGKFVEFFGPSLGSMSLADRATISNMSPENGATATFFPVDQVTLNYLALTGRSEEQIQLVRDYCLANGLFYSSEAPQPNFSKVIDLNLSEIRPSVSGPKRPQDRIPVQELKNEFEQSLTRPAGNHGFGFGSDEIGKSSNVVYPDGTQTPIETGAIVIAAITSCTNTSNPSVMIGAGLVAKKAVERGLKVPSYVKTSLSPGSKVVTDYLEKAGLTPYLDQLGFNLAGYGCMTCIGNSGPLPPEVEKAVTERDLTVTAVLSGNRNFEGRIHPLVRANYLASPPLVVVYALAGTVDFDLTRDSFGKDAQGRDVYFKDLWPTRDEIAELMNCSVKPEMFRKEYGNVYSNNDKWNAIQTSTGELYDWNSESTYIQNPPFFENLSADFRKIEPLKNMRVIGKFGNSVTTDHISPAGAITPKSPAGQFLSGKGVARRDFNSYGSRRGNHEIMMRGTFANIRIRNQIAPGTEGGYTTYWPTGEVLPIYDAAMKYKAQGTGLVVLGGKDYGMGSSRDWAAKGTFLLGIKAVIVESFERIHRSNLVMMGVLPLQFANGQNADKLGLTGKEKISINLDESVKPGQKLAARAVAEEGKETEFQVIACFHSEVEIDYYRNGGILQTVLRKKLR